MARRCAIREIWPWCVLAVGLMLMCSGCAAATDSTAQTGGTSAQRACRYALEAIGESTVQAKHDAGHPGACDRIPRLCQWSIAFSQFRTHTDPGTFTNRAPGSCPARELDAVLQLAARIRLSGPHGVGLCNLLVASQRANAEPVAALHHVSCAEGELEAGFFSYRQIAQPVAYVILFSSEPGPPHWFAYLGFANPVFKTLAPHQPPPPGLPTPVNAAIAKRPDGSWGIFQIPYDP